MCILFVVCLAVVTVGSHITTMLKMAKHHGHWAECLAQEELRLVVDFYVCRVSFTWDNARRTVREGSRSSPVCGACTH